MHNNNNKKKKRSPSSENNNTAAPNNHHGVLMEEEEEEEEEVAVSACNIHSNGGNSSSRNIQNKIISSGSINGVLIGPSPLKSSLKRSGGDDDLAAHKMINHQQGRGTRRVSWSDAHGYDIAHIQFFRSSGSNDGELEGVQNSCVCVIQ